MRCVGIVARLAREHERGDLGSLPLIHLLDIGLEVEALGECLADVDVIEEVGWDAIAVQFAGTHVVVTAGGIQIEGEKHVGMSLLWDAGQSQTGLVGGVCRRLLAVAFRAVAGSASQGVQLRPVGARAGHDRIRIAGLDTSPGG